MRWTALLILAILCMGTSTSSSDCKLKPTPSERLLFNGDPEAPSEQRERVWEFPSDPPENLSGTIAVAIDDVPQHAIAHENMRIELLDYDPDSRAHELVSGDVLNTDSMTFYSEGRYYSLSGEGYGVGVDLQKRFGTFLYGAGGNDIDYAIVYDEGIASVLIPWDTSAAPVDPDYAAALAPFVGGGLHALLLDNLAAELSGSVGEGPEVVVDNIFYYGDWLQNVWFNDSFFETNTQHEVYNDFSIQGVTTYDAAGGVTGRNGDLHPSLCVRSRFFTDGRLDWLPSEPWRGEAWAFLAGGFLLEILGIGECGARLGEVTVCGEFRVSDGPVEVFVSGNAETQRVGDAGQLEFVATNQHAVVNGWPRIRAACNNNRGAMQDTIRDIVAETLPVSINTFAREAIAQNLPFGFEDVHMTHEGLLLVIAYDDGDPDYAAAGFAGFGNRTTTRPATAGTKFHPDDHRP